MKSICIKISLTFIARYILNSKSKAKNIQIFFTDFFNVEDVYNRPGTSGDENWSLRLPNNYAEMQTIDLGEILTMAIKARGSKFADKHKKLIEKLNEK